MRWGRRWQAASCVATTLFAWASTPRAAPAQDDLDEPAAAAVARSIMRIEGYVETAYTYAFAKPGNGVIAQRGFDNRHNTFSLSNALLGVVLDDEEVFGRLALQVGVTPATYYSAEPALRAEGGAGAVDSSLWRHVQEAYGGWRPAALPGFSLDAGVFLSQIGLEPMAVRDAWQWSRSNLFFGLPFYHTGARVHQQLGAAFVLTLAAFNGWNSVIDNNAAKSVSARIAHMGPAWEGAALYFGGIERSAGPQGEPWRHLFDVWAKTTFFGTLDVAGQMNFGWERTRSGSLSWRAAAAFFRYRLTPVVALASRTDAFWETAPTTSEGRLSLFFGVGRVLSQTTTVTLRTHEKLLFMLEHRHDAASAPIYYSGAATTPTAQRQNTLTVGMVLSL